MQDLVQTRMQSIQTLSPDRIQQSITEYIQSSPSKSEDSAAVNKLCVELSRDADTSIASPKDSDAPVVSAPVELHLSPSSKHEPKSDQRRITSRLARQLNLYESLMYPEGSSADSKAEQSVGSEKTVRLITKSTPRESHIST